ncbi:PPC domain-containing protein [Schlesneria paludicola]|uniref:PPC domain-containing protein n=1 Tax=Schlesneria paludicola TaxID=360056 RepID=UPI000299DB04|nr:PPC domain-containing protein [Schlesneria paludicola]
MIRYFALILICASTPVMAASPVLSNILPRGAQRGIETEVLFNGQRLEDAQELMIYEPGIEVTEFTVVNGGQVKAKLKIAADCVLGTKHLRVRTASGLSDLRTLSVSALPTVMEVEPNSEFKQPQAVANNVTVEGIIQNEDVDYFVVEAKKGDRISAEVEGIRLGDFLFDPYVAILNEARFELATSDDAALIWQDGVVSIIAPADGKYIVQIRESSYGGNGSCFYRCHIGNYPRPSAIVPSGGKPGQKVAVKFLGDVGGEFTREIEIPAKAQPDYAVFAVDDRGIAPSGNRFRIVDLENSIEQEPNESIQQATKAVAPIAFNGVLSSKTDADFFGFKAIKGQTLEIHVWARRLRSELDPLLILYNAQGGAIASNDDNAGPDSYLRFGVPEDGEYFLEVRDHLHRGGNAFHYRIEVSPLVAESLLGVSEFVQYVEPKVAIPQGNRFPLLINANRVGFGGALDFKGLDLPAGVTVESFGMAADQGVAQLILAATPEAPLAGKFSQITGTLADPNIPNPPTGEVRLPTVLVRGQNQIPFWTEQTFALATTVTQRVPFTLEIVEPKVPLVQGGQMALKVVATRDPEFKAPIKIELILNPNGVNSSREVSIAEGQNEALISMNSAGNAQVKDHKIAVRGEATVGNGPVMVCSKFVTLRVAEPYVKFTYEAAAIEQGADSELFVKLESPVAFPGNATVQLLGLPNKVTTTPAEFNKDAKELVFKLKAEADAPPGLNKSLFCQVIVTENGEPVIHNIGTGQIRVDKPLPPKSTPAPAPVVAAAPMPTPEAAPPKRLTRLEQLRLDQELRVKAQNAAAAGGDAKPAGAQ